jgi:hypothetical protein
MKIKFLSGPRTGQTDHAPNTQETQLLAKAGIIEIIPYKNAVERLNYESSLLASAPVVTEWGTCEKNGSALVVKKVGAETFYYDAPTADTPDAIKASFARLQAKNSDAQRAANDAERHRAWAGVEHEQLAAMNAKY